MVGQFSQQRSFLLIRTLRYYAYCCKCVKTYKKCVVFETHTDLQATLQMQGRGLEVSDLILGCPELRDERDKGRGYFFA